MIIKNIEAKIRLATFIAAGSLVTSLLICAMLLTYAYKLVSNAYRNIYVLDNNIALHATQTECYPKPTVTRLPLQFLDESEVQHG